MRTENMKSRESLNRKELDRRQRIVNADSVLPTPEKRGKVVSWGDAHACDFVGCQKQAGYRWRGKDGEIAGAACAEHRETVLTGLLARAQKELADRKRMDSPL